MIKEAAERKKKRMRRKILMLLLERGLRGAKIDLKGKN